MNELELIRALTGSLATNESVRIGAGDDCAVLEVGLAEDWIVFKTDAVVEGVHFGKDAAPERIGHKALGRCLSDMAAMAGTPMAAVITLALPANFEPATITKIYDGINALANAHGVAIVGGETVQNLSGMLISVAMIGTVKKDKCLLRSGAKSGDAIFVTGELGGSLAGKHLEFEPRVKEAQWLAANFPIGAMIDLSDGLASDLRHILKASGVGAELHAEAIPISHAARLQAKAESSRKPPLLAALSDGEDFELLFTLPSKEAVPVLDGFKKAFPEVPISCIGKISAEQGLRIRDKEGLRPLTAHGYMHFEKS